MLDCIRGKFVIVWLDWFLGSVEFYCNIHILTRVNFLEDVWNSIAYKSFTLIGLLNLDWDDLCMNYTTCHEYSIGGLAGLYETWSYRQMAGATSERFVTGGEGAHVYTMLTNKWKGISKFTEGSLQNIWTTKGVLSDSV